jgi:hypothetical protein
MARRGSMTDDKNEITGIRCSADLSSAGIRRLAEDMMAIPQLVRFAAPVALSVLLVGCGSSTPAAPDVDQVGHAMQTQVYKLLYATWTTNSKVTDALHDKYISCGNGKVKLTYAVSGTVTSFAATGPYVRRTETKTNAKTKTKTSANAKPPATPKQIIDDLVRYLPELGTFTVTERAADGATVKLVNANTYTRMVLHSPARDTLSIFAETDCLKAGRRDS